MAFNKDILKDIILSNQKDVERYVIKTRGTCFENFPLQIFVGVRRSGKSFLLFQKIRNLLEQGHKWDEMLYIDFEDSRLSSFSSDDFPTIIECHSELYGTRPIMFFDEIQNIDGWEKFARTLADKKYEVYITGSNAKMLSRELMGALGGRYLPTEVYPLSFKEYLQFKDIPYDRKSLLATESRSAVKRAYNDYFMWGGLPESIELPVKRNYMSSLFQKIYLGDIVTRHNIANHKLLQLMLKKMAESVMQPISYNRIAKILSSIGGKVSVPTVATYVGYAEEAWLLLRLRNIASAFAEKESICKYYFIDNGLLSMQLLNAETLLLENMVALALFRKYGHDEDDERVFFYNDGVEVDFYIPEEKMAIQVSYNVDAEKTHNREVESLTKLSKVHLCERRIILTYDESGQVEDSFGKIEIIPCWKWLLDEG